MFGTKQSPKTGEKFLSRVNLLRFLALLLTGLIVFKLFYLQVLRHDYYQNLADRQHKSNVTIPAKRGTVYMQDGLNGSAILATDVSMDLLYIDPALIKESDQEMLADTLAPMLFEEKEEDTSEDFYSPDQNTPPQIFLSTEEFFDTEGNPVETPPQPVAAPEDQVLETREKKIEAYKQNLIKKMARKEVDYVPLLRDFKPELGEQIEQMGLRGVFVVTNEIYADPTLIRDPAGTAEALYELLQIPRDDLQYSLTPREIHYTILKKRLEPQLAEQVLRALEQKYMLLGDEIFPAPADTFDLLQRRLVLKGIGLQPEHQRYYPEGSLAAQLIGFVNKEGIGQYGLEGQYDKEFNGISLRGKAGKLLFDRDASGRQIAVGDKVLDPAIPGDDVYLTINRAVQSLTEKLLEQQVKDFDAEAGHVIVMNVKTGAILAMANYPTYDPNLYEDAYQKYEEGIHAGEYKNKIGPKAFQNSILADVYEPGSVFKIVTLASGLDVNEIEPDTVHCEYSNFQVRDGYRIWNFDKQANGCITMTRVLERSSNLGALWVAEKLGRTLFYNYMKEFGFGEFTGVELSENESRGWIKRPTEWADIDLAAAGFGQGFAVTPLQMISAGAAIANGGKMMRPYIIDKVVDAETGEVHITEPKQEAAPISSESAEKIKAMLISSVQNGFAKTGAVKHYFVAGKTGTSQIAKEDGTGYEEGVGATYGTYFGFAPSNDPQFAILVKIDRPIKDPWGTVVSGPLFSQIMEYLLQYYGIPWETTKA